MSTLNVNSITPSTGTTITIGGSGDTVTLGSGASASGFTSGIVGVSTFTSSGTWTKATREAALGVTIKRVIVEVQGAGGSGTRGSSGGYYNGGSGGGYAKKLLDVSSISSSTITVGSGGASQTGTGAGNNGGLSSWSDGTNTITGNGGLGGIYTPDANVAGASASGGDINITGQNGGTQNGGFMRGGDSFLGLGGFWNNNASADLDGHGYGSGGSSAATGNSQASSGAGSDGIIIVTEIAG